jgi:phosphoesterase RecJ-like protein
MIQLFPDVDWLPVIEAIEQADSIVLITHCNPDGDGIGSQLALYEALIGKGKQVSIRNRDGIPRIYTFLSHAEQVQKYDWPSCHDSPDLLISLDCGSYKRLGMPQAIRDEMILINIDHHVSNGQFGDINIVDARYCATGAMISDLLVAMQVMFSTDIASAIYTAVLTDTSCFRLSSASANIYRLAADLIDAGAQPWPISVAVYESKSLAGMNILTACLETLELRDEGRSAWIYVKSEMYEETGANVEDTEGLIDYARSISGVEVAVLIRCHELEDQWKVNFRAKTTANVGALANSLGGGGHKHAAGCVLGGSFDEVRTIIRQEVSQILG